MLMVVAIVALLASSAQAGLVGYWKMNDNLNNSAPSGSTYNGTHPVGTPSYVTGKLNNALDINGTSEYVDIPNGSSYNWDQGNDIAVSLWFKTDAVQSSKSLLVHYDTQYRYRAYITNNSTQLTWGVRLSNSAYHSASYTLPSGNYADNEWHHFLGVFDRYVDSTGHHDGDGLRLKLYVDGVLRGSSAATDHYIQFGGGGAGAGLWLGRTGTSYFDGQIDDVGIFSQDLLKGESTAVNSLATHTLNYDLGEAEQLIDLHNAGSGTDTVDGRLWSYATGLTSALGVVTQVGSNYHLKLDDTGTGVTAPVPEPATMTLLLLGLPLALRRRKK